MDDTHAFHLHTHLPKFFPLNYINNWVATRHGCEFIVVYILDFSIALLQLSRIGIWNLFSFFSVACLLVALIVFPVMFVTKIQEYRAQYNKTEWYFSWSYGISWGAWLFLFGAAILLLIDKVRNKAVRKEKGFYDTNLWRKCPRNTIHGIHEYQCLD